MIILAPFSFSQGNINQLIAEGIELFDQGEYEAALTRFNSAIQLDSTNLTAQYEKAYTEMALQENASAKKSFQRCLEIADPEDETLGLVYSSYGSLLNIEGSSRKAVDIYDQGLEKFPNFYLLHYNRALALVKLGDNPMALSSFEKGVLNKSGHTSSQIGVGILNAQEGKRIPAVMAFSRFLMLEYEGQRANQALDQLDQILQGNVEKTGRKSVTINIHPEDASSGESEETVNDFGVINMSLDLMSALDYDKEYKKETEPERYLRKMSLVIEMLEEQKEKNSGFYWEYYAPYFIQLKQKGHLEALSYVVYSSRSGDNKKSQKWIEGNLNKIKALYEWSSEYEWPSN